jgi:Spy/CpxP family protein refolding chaperone
MKRNHLIAAIIAVLAVTTIAFAAGPGFGPRHPGDRDGWRGAAMKQRVATILDLSEAQLSQWNAIQTATHEKMDPLAAQRRANAAALRAEMTGEQPSSTRVGDLMIANRQIAEQMRELREQSRAQFEAILTPEQKTRHDELKALRPNRGEGRRGGMRGGGGRGWQE